MKQLLMIIAVIGLVQTAKAQSWQYMPENLSLVQERLNKDIYKFENKIVNFSMSKNREVAHLKISNNICPEANGGFSCLAMPAVVLNATYTVRHVATDDCGVQTLISNNVDVGNKFMKNQKRYAQVRITDFTYSVCEMVYPSDVKVELKETTLDSELDKVEIHYSTMLFDYAKTSGPVSR
ncbi:MAG: hypothetical protein V4654_06050 [Bdellovibrionota bacterium]